MKRKYSCKKFGLDSFYNNCITFLTGEAVFLNRLFSTKCRRLCEKAYHCRFGSEILGAHKTHKSFNYFFSEILKLRTVLWNHFIKMTLFNSLGKAQYKKKNWEVSTELPSR